MRVDGVRQLLQEGLHQGAMCLVEISELVEPVVALPACGGEEERGVKNTNTEKEREKERERECLVFFFNLFCVFVILACVLVCFG